MDIQSLQTLIQTQDNISLSDALSTAPTLAEKKTVQGLSLLVFAAYCRNQEAVGLLKNARTSPLSFFELIILGESAEVKQAIRADKDLLNAYHVDGFSPLGLACYFAHEPLVKDLLQLGASVNMASNNDFKITPLHSACAISNLAIAKLLLSGGANPNVKQASGVTPLHSAAHNGNLALVQVLVESGADIKARTNEGKDALDFARADGFPAIEAYLLKQID